VSLRIQLLPNTQPNLDHTKRQVLFSYYIVPHILSPLPVERRVIFILRLEQNNTIVVYMSKKLVGSYLFFIVASFFLLAPSALATKFDLIPPSGTLQRGQDITFTINIDTEGAAVTSIQSGLTYDSTLLKYVSVTAGAAMNSVVADTTTYGTGKILFTGTNNTGYNGTGVFATVVFNIIAQSSGSTEICTLWVPETTPTLVPSPTAPPNSTPVPTLPPQPTSLPQTGVTDSRNTAVAFGISFFVAAGGIFYLSQKQKYSFPDSPSKTAGHKTKTDKKS
jgi:LPXTG-motif cell wall-anchored protein